METLIEQWLRYAEQDYGVAEHLYSCYHPKPLEIICYHCQQAAEKAVKAVIISYGAPGGVPKSHDLGFLLNQIKNFADVECIVREAQGLTPFGVITRYPGETDLEEQNAVQAIAYAKRILAWARENIKAD